MFRINIPLDKVALYESNEQKTLSDMEHKEKTSKEVIRIDFITCIFTSPYMYLIAYNSLDIFIISKLLSFLLFGIILYH